MVWPSWVPTSVARATVLAWAAVPVDRAISQAPVVEAAVVPARMMTSEVRAVPRDVSGPSRRSSSGSRRPGGRTASAIEGSMSVSRFTSISWRALSGDPARGEQARAEGERDLPEVAADEDGDGVPDGGPRRSGFDHRVDDGFDAVVDDDEVRGFPRGVGAAVAERDTDVGEADGRRVVRAVAGHRDRVSGLLQGPDDADLVGWRHAGEHRDLRQQFGEFVIVHCVHVGAGEHGTVGEDAELGRDRLGRARVVTGGHDDPYAALVQALDGLGGGGAYRVREGEQAQKRQAGDAVLVQVGPASTRRVRPPRAAGSPAWRAG